MSSAFENGMTDQQAENYTQNYPVTPYWELVEMTSSGDRETAIEDRVNKTILSGTLDVLEVKGDWVRVGWNQWCMKQYNGMRYLG